MQLAISLNNWKHARHGPRVQAKAISFIANRIEIQGSYNLKCKLQPILRGCRNQATPDVTERTLHRWSETYDDDEDCRGKALRSELESVIIFTNKKSQIDKITNYASLERILPMICNSIFNMLSSTEREGTYQRCLAIDLIEAGVEVVEEVDIPIIYKGAQVNSRRADLVVTTPTDGKKTAIELKAVASLNSNHLKQLQFYMHHFKLDTGFLINFPHIPEFPHVETTFTHELLQGDNIQLSDRSTRGKNAVATVEIVKIQSVPSSFTVTATQQQEIIDAATTATATVFVAPFTNRGTPCKNCTKQQALCYQHRS